jgi:hypothetical protein
MNLKKQAGGTDWIRLALDKTSGSNLRGPLNFLTVELLSNEGF